MHRQQSEGQTEHKLSPVSPGQCHPQWTLDNQQLLTKHTSVFVLAAASTYTLWHTHRQTYRSHQPEDNATYQFNTSQNHEGIKKIIENSDQTLNQLETDMKQHQSNRHMLCEVEVHLDECNSTTGSKYTLSTQ